MQHQWFPSWASRWLVVVWVVIATALNLSAQDPSFSQFYANRIYLNPAFAGIEPGITVSGAARMQWYAVDKGFRTVNFSAEMQLPMVKSGLAIHVLNNTEGIGNLTTNQAGLVYSYTLPGKNNNFHFGIEGRLTQKSIDWSQLVFTDQIDKVYGNIYASTMTPVNDQVLFGDVDFGFVWRNDGGIKIKHLPGSIRSHLGVSFNHFPNLFRGAADGNDSFLNMDGRVAPRTTIHGGMIIPITFFRGKGLDIALSPNFKLDNQGYRFMSFSENITVGTFGLYALVSDFYVGLLYQNRFYAPSHLHTDALIFTVGGYTATGKKGDTRSPNLFYGISVDLNNSGLGALAGSVFELTFRYRFDANLGNGGRQKSGKNARGRILDCKSFF
ncbi:MAG: PorP/SprF family type IX secretion system membrane protein [Bacteroidota bacterium]